MGAFVSYMLQVAVVMTLLYLAYKWVMAPTTFHRLNRLTLLGIYAVSWTLPALIPLLAPAHEPSGNAVLPLGIEAVGIMPAPAEETGLGWWRAALAAYLAGAAASALFSIAGAVRMSRIIRSGSRSDEGEYLRIVSESAPGPFSWWRYMVLRPEDCDSDMQMVVAHEQAHLLRRHWLDLLAAQLTAILQWFSPAAWLMMRELKTVHEFQADSDAAGGDPAAYQMMLLKKTVGSSFPTFADSLNHSQIKLRITMMMTKRTSPSRKVAALALPAMAALAVFTLSVPAVADVVRHLGSATLADGRNPLGKITESPAAVQIPVPEGVAEGVLHGDSASEATAESAAETAMEENAPAEEKKELGSPAIFIDGKEFKGDLSSINPKDIVKMDVVKNDPAYPQGKIMITTVNAADGSPRVAFTSEKTADYKGGMPALLKFIGDNIQYPSGGECVSGRVIVSFTINTDGTVADTKILKGIDPAFDKEAERVVKLTSGNWIPASNGGKPVATSYTIPIVFKPQP